MPDYLDDDLLGTAATHATDNIRAVRSRLSTTPGPRWSAPADPACTAERNDGGRVPSGPGRRPGL
ncbi:hypothetical protein MN0502_08800 [Arthrobacter sp. MN05-02]|nr:hypothetical protein MN0502_08800 [Arthrobacter sp. MN05-02]